MSGGKDAFGGKDLVVGVVVPANGMHTTLDPADKRRAFDEDRQRANKEFAEKQAAMKVAQALADRRERIFQAAVLILAGLRSNSDYGSWPAHEIADSSVMLTLALEQSVSEMIK